LPQAFLSDIIRIMDENTAPVESPEVQLDTIDPMLTASAAELVAAVPEDVRQMMLLRSCGVSHRRIGQFFGVSHVTILTQLRKYDPTGLVKYNPAAGRALICSMLHDKMFAILAAITDDKLREAPAGHLAQLLNVVATHMEKFSFTEKKENRDLRGLLLQLRLMSQSRLPATEAEPQEEPSDSPGADQ